MGMKYMYIRNDAGKPVVTIATDGSGNFGMAVCNPTDQCVKSEGKNWAKISLMMPEFTNKVTGSAYATPEVSAYREAVAKRFAKKVKAKTQEVEPMLEELELA